MKKKAKATIAITAIAVLLCVIVSGTLAWLVDQTDEVTNTFTYGDINITLDETTEDYKMVPGNKIAKDPKVTVEAGSEDCYLFVKIEKSDNYSTYLEDYAVAEDWTALDGVAGVYWREAEAGDSFFVLAGEGAAELKDGFVTVKTTVTKEQMTAIKDSGMPTLTFTAYAVQKDNVADAATAWGYVSNPDGE